MAAFHDTFEDLYDDLFEVLDEVHGHSYPIHAGAHGHLYTIRYVDKAQTVAA